MKKVLLVMAYRPDREGKVQQISFLYGTYVRKLVENSLIPIPCPSQLPEEMIRDLLKDAGGVLFMGGADVHPQLYNQEPGIKTKPSNPLRDHSESLIFRIAVEKRKPFLGICRGMQIANALLGGSLYQHLPEVESEEEHWVTGESPSYDEVASDRGQYLTVLPDTLLSSVVGEGRQLVRCAHHQAVDKVGPGLIINAVSDKGVIEGLEGIDPSRFIMLIQSHIETQNTEFANGIWKEFARRVAST